METRLLILNADPVFQDRALSLFDLMDGVETRIVRALSDAITVLLGENFDAFIVEGEAHLAVEQATNARQHFPSLQIVCQVRNIRMLVRPLWPTSRISRLSVLIETMEDLTGSCAASCDQWKDRLALRPRESIPATR